MQRMWRHALAAVLGVFALGNIASAQYQYPATQPNQLPQMRPGPVQGYMLVPIPAGYGAPGSSAPGYGASGYAAPVQPASGCAGCANGADGGYSKSTIPYGVPGPAGANGCGSCRADLGFIFGSCKQFFDPCGPGVCEGTHRFKGRHGGSHPFAKPYGTGYNGCTYDSYLNH